MSITVVGSVAYDTVTTSYGKSIRQLGGSAIYFSLASSKFTNVYPVGVYGDDFENYFRFFGRENIKKNRENIIKQIIN